MIAHPHNVLPLQGMMSQLLACGFTNPLRVKMTERQLMLFDAMESRQRYTFPQLHAQTKNEHADQTRRDIAKLMAIGALHIQRQHSANGKTSMYWKK
ncbi:hypothetical protein LQR31_21015 [Chromobacterium vaccinii]|uniref:hypothetical protein n=1 Tax=Chromobacterium vaccinii TaxID=1108595 RepID=UPI001E4A9538|nr:hypothetical protein [Chromobacterium vaccinii]MCD4486957.1 hypothetical protein [Chromobacterium vaccinii]